MLELDEDFLIKLWKLKNEDPEKFKVGGEYYPDWVCEIFRKRPKSGGGSGSGSGSGVVWEGDLERDIVELMEQVKNIASSLDEIPDIGDQMNYFRVRVALAEKLVTLKEKIWNQKNMSLFYKRILEVFEKVLDDDQKEKFLEEIKKVMEE